MRVELCEICGKEIVDVDGRVHLFDNDSGYLVCENEECEEIAFNKLVEDAGDTYFEDISF